MVYRHHPYTKSLSYIKIYKMGKEARIVNADDIELTLKKIYTDRGEREYRFVLCCKKILEIYNPCPGQPIALKIDQCFDVEFENGDHTVFCLGDITENLQHDIDGDLGSEGPSNLVFYHQSLSVDSEYTSAHVNQNKGSYTLDVQTDETIHTNKVCVKNICIPVTADCLHAEHINSCVKLSNFFSVVCVDKHDEGSPDMPVE